MSTITTATTTTTATHTTHKEKPTASKNRDFENAMIRGVPHGFAHPFKQLWAAYKKCSLVKLRSLVFTIIEIFSPLILIGPILAGYIAAGNNFHPAQIFVNTSFPATAPDDMVICMDPAQFVVLPDPQPIPLQCFDLLDTLNYTGPMPLLGFDQWMLAHTMLHGAFMGNLTYDELSTFEQKLVDEFGNLINNGVLLFACGNQASQATCDEVHQFELKMSQTSPFFSTVFTATYDTETEALSWLRDNPGKAWGLIVFNLLDLNAAKVDYAIRLNFTQVPYTGIKVNTLIQGMDTTFQYYFFSGFLALQDMVIEYVSNMTQQLGGSVFYAPFPINSYTDNIFYLFIGPFLGMVMILTVLYPASRLIKEIVEEKENCIKETLRMMGMPLWVNSMSWSLTYTLMFAVTALADTTLECLTFFPKTNVVLMFIFNFEFLLSIIAFSVMLSTIFSRAKLAGVVCPLTIFASVIPRYLFMSAEDNQLVSAKMFTSLLSPSAYSFGCDTIAKFEYVQKGISLSTLGEGPYPFAVTLVILAIDTAIYAFIAWYLEHVLPSQYGIRKPPYFFFTPEYWRGHRWDIDFTNDIVESGDTVEEVDPSVAQKAVVRIRNLTKRYSDGKLAVNNLYLTMYRDQITCLLGHNGAGKSTTISMITGLIEATSGNCFIENNSIMTDMGRIRNSLGVCPQRNVIFPGLTVTEHLILVAMLKGVPWSQIDKACKAMVRLVGLKGKNHSKAGHLSGGMKRKLCMGMALIGGSEVVVLDEPTSGMDPYSRRATWDLLRECKKGRVILLTTHYMDEADLLGDRVAVMSAGQLQCVGSSLFLKTRYGVGYTLTIAKEEGAQESTITQVISSVIPDAKFVSSSAREVAYCLPMSSVDKFARLFSMFDSGKPDIGLASYGVSMTTLEEVFLRLAEENERRLAEQEENSTRSCCGLSGKLWPSEPTNKDELDEEISLPAEMEWDKQYKPASPLIQFFEMFKKRFVTSRRDTKGILFQLLVPVITVALVLLMLRIKIDPTGPKLILEPSLFDSEIHPKAPEPTEFIYAEYSPYADIYAPLFTSPNITVLPVPCNDSLCLSQWLLDSSMKHESGRFGAYSFGDVLYHPSAPGPVAATLLHNVTSPHAIPVFLNELSRAALAVATGIPTASVVVASQPMPLTGREEQQIQAAISALAALFMLVPFSFVAANFVIFIVKERAVKAKHLQLTCGVNVYSFWAANLCWDVVAFFIVTCLVMVVFGVYRNDSFVGTVDRFFATALLVFFYGISALCMSYTLSFLFTSGMGAQLGIAGITFVLGFGLVMASVILDTLPKTTEINSHLKTLYRIFPPFLFGEGLINLSSAPLIASLTGKTENAFDIDIAGRALVLLLVEAVFYIVVTLCIDNGLFRWVFGVISRKLRCFKRCCKPKMASPSGNDTRSNELTTVARSSSDTSVIHGFSTTGEDEDVAAERKRVAAMIEGSPKDMDAITLYNLRKVFTSRGRVTKVAVNDICLGIPKGECFGFLGTNGAGKTTTLSMLTHDMSPTSGDAWISGYSVVNDFKSMQSEVGYCPQFDPLLDKMTGREHLRMFGKLKGIPYDKLDLAVQQLIDYTGLSHYADKVAEAYSGGNKRKLSLAIALVGAPRVVFLDEPSSGMDPVARRSMWSVIKAASQTKSIVITSHSMEETEALCNRVGILVNGTFRCLGSIQHLKSRFGSSLFLEIKTTEDRVSSVEQWLCETFEGAELAEKHAGRIKYIIPKGTTTNLHSHSRKHAKKTTLATIFAAIEAEKHEIGIIEYSVSQPTLEQIFVSIARQQEEEDAEAEAVVEEGTSDNVEEVVDIESDSSDSDG